MTKEHIYSAYDIISRSTKILKKINGENNTRLKFTRLDQLVLERVAFHASSDSIYIGGFQRLATELDCSVRSIGRSFNNLTDIGLIIKIKNGGGGLNESYEEVTTCSEWKLKFDPLPGIPDCFGRRFARWNYELRIRDQQEEEKSPTLPWSSSERAEAIRELDAFDSVLPKLELL